jgi:hypothetical protein
VGKGEGVPVASFLAPAPTIRANLIVSACLKSQHRTQNTTLTLYSLEVPGNTLTYPEVAEVGLVAKTVDGTQADGDHRLTNSHEV